MLTQHSTKSVTDSSINSQQINDDDDDILKMGLPSIQ